MPRLNRHGDIAERRREWFDDTRTVFQHCDTHCVVLLSSGEVVAERAANKVCGGGGVWAAWENAESGVFDSLGRTLPGHWLGAVGPDGAICVVHPSPTVFGPWVVIERSGQQWTLSEVSARAIQLLGHQRAIWLEGDTVRCTEGLPIILPNEPVWWPRAVFHDGRFLLLYQSQRDGSLVLDGRIIAPPGHYFYPDVVFRDGFFDIVWSPYQSDTEPRRLILSPEQLAACPPITPIDVTPPPVDPVPPTPEPSMPDSLLSTVEAVRAKYPTPPSPDQLGLMLNEIAWTHRAEGWGLNLKPAGNSCPQPRTGVRIAVDILHHQPTDTIWDCFRDAGGTTEPTWHEAEPHGDPARVWVAPVAPDGVPAPEPPPLPPPVPGFPQDLELVKRVEALERRLQRLENAGLTIATIYRP